MAAAARANPSSEWASQAAINALLRYKPQKEGLAELKRAAEERFQGEVQAGKSEGTLGQQAAQGAIAPTQNIFSTAAAEGERGRALSAPILAALSADSPFKAAAANEQAAGGERLAQSQAHALSDLQQRSVAASELPAFTRQAATTRLLKELGSIQQKGQLLQGSEGADVQSEIDKQRGEARKASLTERGQNLSRQSAQEGHALTARGQNLTRQSAKEAHEGKGKSGAPLTTKEQDEAASQILQIRHYAAEGGNSRAERVAALTEGRPEQSTKNKKGEAVKVPAVPAFKPDVKMSAALDWAEYGHLTRGTEKRLKAAGYNVEALGIPKAPPAPKTPNDYGKKVLKAIQF